MANLFLDSAKHLAAADLTLKYTSVSGVTIGSGTGRFGGNCYNLNGNNGDFLQKTLPVGAATLIQGFAWKFPTIPASGPHIFFQFLDAGTTQCDLRMMSSGQIQVTRNGTVLGTSTLAISAGVHFFELKITFHPSAGVVELRVDGVVFLSLTGQNTRNTANSTANQFKLGQANTMGTGHLVEDIYCNDDTGAKNNSFEGDCRVQLLTVTGAGNYAQWTPSAGSNFQNVDDTTPNGDSDYNSSSTVNQIDSFALSDLLAGTAGVKAVQVGLVERKDDAGTRQVADLLRIGGADYVGTTQTLSTAYQLFLRQYDVSPATSADWTVSELNAMEAGYKEIA